MVSACIMVGLSGLTTWKSLQPDRSVPISIRQIPINLRCFMAVSYSFGSRFTMLRNTRPLLKATHHAGWAYLGYLCKRSYSKRPCVVDHSPLYDGKRRKVNRESA